MKLSRVLRISRPRFWIYELGPFMIGILGGLLTYVLMVQGGASTYAIAEIGLGPVTSVAEIFRNHWVSIMIFAVYFLISANIRIYGINDIYDYETDKLNPKKLL
jgi:lycopene elongase/hydratase (dihydrobisanhydrobacterioruberin-forming)